MPHKTMSWSICMKNSMNIHKIAGVLCALQSVTNLGAKCNQTPPLKPYAIIEFPTKLSFKRKEDELLLQLKLELQRKMILA